MPPPPLPLLLEEGVAVSCAVGDTIIPSVGVIVEVAVMVAVDVIVSVAVGVGVAVDVELGATSGASTLFCVEGGVGPFTFAWVAAVTRIMSSSAAGMAANARMRRERRGGWAMAMVGGTGGRAVVAPAS